METLNKRCLIISCGGAPQPLIYSINNHHPEYLVFFASLESVNLIEKEILPYLEDIPPYMQTVKTENAQSLNICFTAALRKIPSIINEWGVDWEEVVVDNTGGTKMMSSALLLALIDKVSTFTYVGGSDVASRSKQGVGIVLDGKEYIFEYSNPWEEIARDRLKEINILYSKARYSTALDIIQSIQSKIQTHLKYYLRGLEKLLIALQRWDNFEYNSMLKTYDKGLKHICTFLEYEDKAEVQEFIEQLKHLKTVAEKISCEYKGINKKDFSAEYFTSDTRYELIIDLISNSIRRADKEGKYEDAVARLYSTVEKIFKIRLMQKYNINNSKLKLQSLPEGIRDNYKENQQIGLIRSGELLYHLKDPFGIQMQRHQTDLNKILNIRNISYLAHGFNVVRKETYENMLNIVLRILNLEISSIHQFPDLPELY